MTSPRLSRRITVCGVGCWCMAFDPEGVGSGRTSEGNREAKRQHVERGTVHQVLVYDGDLCVGCVSVRGAAGDPQHQESTRVRARDARSAGLADRLRLHSIRKIAGRRVAAAAVAAALEAIRQAGGGVVEAYPEQTQDRPPQRGAYLHTGPEELFAQHGFVRVRRIAKWRWVMQGSPDSAVGVTRPAQPHWPFSDEGEPATADSPL